MSFSQSLSHLVTTLSEPIKYYTMNMLINTIETQGNTPIISFICTFKIS